VRRREPRRYPRLLLQLRVVEGLTGFSNMSFPCEDGYRRSFAALKRGGLRSRRCDSVRSNEAAMHASPRSANDPKRTC
jgi:hypothetical protein